MSPRCPRGSLLALLALCSGLSGLSGGSGPGRCRVGPVTPGTLHEHCPEVALSPPGDTGHRPGELAELEAGQDLGLGLNQIHLYKPFLEQPWSFGGHPGDSPGIEAFLERHGRAILRKVKAQSMSEIWEDTSDGIYIVAFAQGDDPDGFEFLETLREVAGDKRDDPDFSILWIDPRDLPMLVPSCEDTFDIDLSRPQLGVLNGTDPASSMWLDMEDEEDLPGPEEVLEWLEEVLEGDDDEHDNEDEDEDDDHDDDDKVDDNDNDAE